MPVAPAAETVVASFGGAMGGRIAGHRALRDALHARGQPEQVRAFIGIDICAHSKGVDGMTAIDWQDRAVNVARGAGSE
ncbi:hypothetical protein SAMN04515620_1515 [Collimonas sp. OK607]|nr:hypothetical protein SAMN04515620_1515 [Collimonas sp. OK607]